MYPFEAEGIITYDAPRGNLKSHMGWWCTIELDDNELARYCRWWIDKLWWDADSRTMKRSYHKPPHQSHISLIRGEKPTQNIDDWNEYMAGQRVRFKYDHIIRQTSNAFYADEPDKFWFIDIEWDGYVDFRKHFGLSWEYKGKPFRGHMTVARTYE